MTYSTYAMADLLDAFASSDPVPGGGSAAALSGAVGASLLLMVAGLSKTRTGAPEEVADLAQAATRLRPLRDALAALVDRDSEAYAGVVAAFRLPRASDQETATRRDAIAAAMRAATGAPLDTMRHCQQALGGAVVIAGNGCASAASDVKVGVEMLMAGVRGAGVNVDINLAGLKDEAYAAHVKNEREQLEQDAAADAARARELL